jgi:hypothetical protein
MIARTVTLDSIARKMAAEAGVAWRELSDFPGYARGCWREETRWLIRRFLPAAVLIEGARQWNGRSGVALVANLTDEDMALVIERGGRQAKRWALP